MVKFRKMLLISEQRSVESILAARSRFCIVEGRP
jgi:hypothetical protein